MSAGTVTPHDISQAPWLSLTGKHHPHKLAKGKSREGKHTGEQPYQLSANKDTHQ